MSHFITWKTSWLWPATVLIWVIRPILEQQPSLIPGNINFYFMSFYDKKHLPSICREGVKNCHFPFSVPFFVAETGLMDGLCYFSRPSFSNIYFIPYSFFYALQYSMGVLADWDRNRWFQAWLISSYLRVFFICVEQPQLMDNVRRVSKQKQSHHTVYRSPVTCTLIIKTISSSISCHLNMRDVGSVVMTSRKNIKKKSPPKEC